MTVENALARRLGQLLEHREPGADPFGAAAILPAELAALRGEIGAVRQDLDARLAVLQDVLNGFHERSESLARDSAGSAAAGMQVVLDRIEVLADQQPARIDDLRQTLVAALAAGRADAAAEQAAAAADLRGDLADALEAVRQRVTTSAAATADAVQRQLEQSRAEFAGQVAGLREDMARVAGRLVATRRAVVAGMAEVREELAPPAAPQTPGRRTAPRRRRRPDDDPPQRPSPAPGTASPDPPRPG